MKNKNTRKTKKEKNAKKRLEDAIKFEKVASYIYQLLSPSSKVTHNDIINGRQIDISIRTKISGHDILVIINTKNQTRRINVNQVGELFAVMHDVKAQKGVIICNKGFTAGAKKFAHDNGIDLCHIHDAETKDWKKEIKIPIILEEIIPTVNFSYEMHLEAHDSIDHEAFFLISGINIREKIIDDWNSGKISFSEDTQKYSVNINQPTIKTTNNKDIPLKNISISIILSRTFLFGYFDDLPKSKALINESTGETTLVILQEDIETLNISTLLKIENPESAPVPVTTEHLRILKVPKINIPAEWNIKINRRN